MKADELEAQLESIRKGECAIVSPSDIGTLQSIADSMFGSKASSATKLLAAEDFAAEPKDLDGYQFMLRFAAKLSDEVRRQARERKNLEHQLVTAAPASIRKAMPTPGKAVVDAQQLKELQRLSDENATIKREV